MQKNSASQIKTFDEECERKWGWRIIAGQPDDFSGPAAELGTEVDDTQLQPYLRDGRPFDLTRDSGHIALSALEWLPKPKIRGLEVQKHFVLGSAVGDWGYQGYKDLWLPYGGLTYLPPGGSDVIVVDFKTTSDFKWVKTEEGLSKDVQAQLYAMNAMVETGARVVDLVWIYMRTKGARKSKKVHLRVVADHVGEQFDRIEGISERMFALRDAAKGESDAKKFVLQALKPNPDMCDRYNGCPYEHLCNLSPGQKKSAFAGALEKGKRGMGLLASLKARAAAADTGVMGMSDAAVPAPVGPTAFEAPPVMLGINPPEKDLPPAPPVGIASASVPFAEAAPPAVEKPKRGRPKKSAGEADAGGQGASGGIDFERISQSFKALEAICASLAEAFKGAA